MGRFSPSLPPCTVYLLAPAPPLYEAVSAPSAAWAEISQREGRQKKTTLRLFSLFFVAALFRDLSRLQREKKKLPSPSPLASRAALALPPTSLSSPPPSFLHQSLTPCLHPSQSSLCSLESIRCTAAFPPLGGRAALRFAFSPDCAVTWRKVILCK